MTHVSSADVDLRSGRVQIETQWVGSTDAETPLIVFLHEGLGSVSMWRDFPQRLCEAANCRGLVYSRPGYGRSTPRASTESWAPDFMHVQAHEMLPALLAAVDVDVNTTPPFLFGHSDGGTIALLYAARFPNALAGAIVLAPHIFVEEVSLRSIASARDAYVGGDLRPRLARHHADPDSAFWGWNNAWLNPAFADWAITDELAPITAPLLAIQGQGDEYGTLAQIRGIADRVPATTLLELPNCGHSPQRDQPDAVVAAVAKFLAQHRVRAQ